MLFALGPRNTYGAFFLAKFFTNKDAEESLTAQPIKHATMKQTSTMRVIVLTVMQFITIMWLLQTFLIVIVEPTGCVDEKVLHVILMLSITLCVEYNCVNNIAIIITIKY